MSHRASFPSQEWTIPSQRVTLPPKDWLPAPQRVILPREEQLETGRNMANKEKLFYIKLMGYLTYCCHCSIVSVTLISIGIANLTSKNQLHNRILLMVK